MDSNCGFCGQRHQRVMIGPFPVVLCPNMPDSWSMMGYPGDDQVLITPHLDESAR